MQHMRAVLDARPKVTRRVSVDDPLSSSCCRLPAVPRPTAAELSDVAHRSSAG